MANIKALGRGFHKIIQNYFVMKSNTSFGGRSGKCNKPRPKDQTAKCPERNVHSSSPEAIKAAFWKKVSVFGAFPTVGIVAGLVFLSIKNESEKERPAFVKYEYMRIRNKRFPWGDGNKSFFHNPRVNALPDGYED